MCLKLGRNFYNQIYKILNSKTIFYHLYIFIYIKTNFFHSYVFKKKVEKKLFFKRHSDNLALNSSKKLPSF